MNRLVIAVSMLAVASGCCSVCPPCDPLIERVETAPEIVIKPYPKVDPPPRPRIDSLDPENFGLSTTDPTAWLRLAIPDLARCLDAYAASLDIFAAINTTPEVD